MFVSAGFLISGASLLTFAFIYKAEERWKVFFDTWWQLHQHQHSPQYYRGRHSSVESRFILRSIGIFLLLFQNLFSHFLHHFNVLNLWIQVLLRFYFSSLSLVHKQRTDQHQRKPHWYMRKHLQLGNWSGSAGETFRRRTVCFMMSHPFRLIFSWLSLPHRCDHQGCSTGLIDSELWLDFLRPNKRKFHLISEWRLTTFYLLIVSLNSAFTRQVFNQWKKKRFSLQSTINEFGSFAEAQSCSSFFLFIFVI